MDLFAISIAVNHLCKIQAELVAHDPGVVCFSIDIRIFFNLLFQTLVHE